jgi:ribosomal protein S18 acetylase RimI-like enzyme
MADHKELCRIARSHRAGNGFTNGLMFSGEVHYSKGWLRVAEQDGKIVGFTCVRHKVRQPKTMLYYIIIAPEARRLGLGKMFLRDLMQQAETHGNRCIELSCLKDNAEALAFYAKHGFVQSGESLKGKGWHLEKAW